MRRLEINYLSGDVMPDHPANWSVAFRRAEYAPVIGRPRRAFAGWVWITRFFMLSIRHRKRDV